MSSPWKFKLPSLKSIEKFVNSSQIYPYKVVLCSVIVILVPTWLIWEQWNDFTNPPIYGKDFDWEYTAVAAPSPWAQAYIEEENGRGGRVRGSRRWIGQADLEEESDIHMRWPLRSVPISCKDKSEKVVSDHIKKHNLTLKYGYRLEFDSMECGLKYMDAGHCVKTTHVEDKESGRTTVYCMPIFVIPGTQKAGTGTIRQFLIAHEYLDSAEGFSAEGKEINYFNSDRKIEDYLEIFPYDERKHRKHLQQSFRPNEKKTKSLFKNQISNIRENGFVSSSFEAGGSGPIVEGGFFFDKSPNYLPNAQSFSNMARYAPSMLLVLFLRNPTDRAYSNFNHDIKGNHLRWVKIVKASSSISKSISISESPNTNQGIHNKKAEKVVDGDNTFVYYKDHPEVARYEKLLKEELQASKKTSTAAAGKEEASIYITNKVLDIDFPRALELLKLNSNDNKRSKMMDPDDMKPAYGYGMITWGLYYRDILNILKYFPKDQLMIFWFEKAMANLLQTLYDIETFTGIPHADYINKIEYNPLGRIRLKTPVSTKLVEYVLAPFINALGLNQKLLSAQDCYNTGYTCKGRGNLPLDSESRLQLDRYFAPHNNQLLKLFYEDDIKLRASSSSKRNYGDKTIGKGSVGHVLDMVADEKSSKSKHNSKSKKQSQAVKKTPAPPPTNWPFQCKCVEKKEHSLPSNKLELCYGSTALVRILAEEGNTKDSQMMSLPTCSAVLL